MNLLFKVLFFSLITLFTLSEAFAQMATTENSSVIVNEKDLYLINGLSTTSTGPTPSQAKETATSKAQREAFLTLLTRLSIDISFADYINDEEISNMIKSRQITNEKISNNDYYAIFNIEFSKSFVNSTFLKKKIRKDTPDKENLILLPVKITNEKFILWEKSNDWKSVSEAIIQDNSFQNIIIPTGDAFDSSKINIDNIQGISYGEVKPLLAKYRGKSLYIAYFEFDNIENKTIITLQIIRNHQATKQVKLGFVNVENLNYNNLVKKVSEKLMEYILSPNNKTIEDQALYTKVDLTILISNLNDWLQIKDKLESSNLVNSMLISSISKDFVKISVNYTNQDEDIISAFVKIGLKLDKKYENSYILSK